MSVVKSPITADSKPVVWIYTATSTTDKNVQFIQLGLEEEGIPCEVHTVTDSHSAHELAAKAAKASALGVGVGLVATSKEAALHHRDLPDEEKLIEVHQDIFDPNTLRRLGANSARFVKGTPLMPVVAVEVEAEVVTENSQPPPPQAGCHGQSTPSLPASDDGAVDMELLVRVVIEVVEKLNSQKANS